MMQLRISYVSVALVAILLVGCGVPDARDVNGLVKVVVKKVAKGKQLTLVHFSKDSLETSTVQEGDTLWVMSDTTMKPGTKFYVSSGMMVFMRAPHGMMDASIASNDPSMVEFVSRDAFGHGFAVGLPMICPACQSNQCKTVNSVLVRILRPGPPVDTTISTGSEIWTCLPADWRLDPLDPNAHMRMPKGAMIQWGQAGSMQTGIIQEPVDIFFFPMR